MKKNRLISFGLILILILHMLPVQELLAAPDENSTGMDEAVSDDKLSDTDEAASAVENIEAENIETIEINTVEDFLDFADHCHLDTWSADKEIILKQDIDLSDTAFETVPVFAGTFDGRGHTIHGFHPTDQGYIVGLFRYIEKDGIVKNLSLTGNITATNEKECIGSICGINYGTIRNCIFQGIASGQNTVGGIAGINEAAGNISGCLVNGHIKGYYSTGGIAGSNHGIITFCNNRSDINNDIAWVEEDDEMTSGPLFGIQFSEDDVELYSGVDTGGIAGYSDGLIERCNNYGKVGYEHTGYNIGGIVGRQSGMVLLCTNNGEVYGRKDVGGIVGQMEPDIEIDEAQSLKNAVSKLHELIDKTLTDMHTEKNVIKADLDQLSLYGDGALSSGNALAGQMTDFVDDNMEQAQAITDRMEHIIDLLPDIMDDVSDAGDAFGRLNDVVSQLIKDLDFTASLDDGAYNETDYNRITLLSTVGGRLISSSLNPAEGETVTITVAPDSGYKLDGELSVVDVNGVSITCSGENANDSGSSRYTFTMPSANVQVTAYFQYIQQNNQEADLETEPSSDLGTGLSDESETEPGDEVSETFDFQADTESNTDMQIILHSNLSGNASYILNKNTVTLTVNPDTAYTLSSSPLVTDANGKSLSAVKVLDGSYQYEFDVTDAVSPVTVEINFTKQDKNTAIDTSVDNIQSSIRDLQENSSYIEGCLNRINEIMTDSGGNIIEWKDLDNAKREEVIDEITKMADYLGKMSSSASSVLSSLSTIYNVLSPYIQEAAEAAKKDADQAAIEIQSMISSLKEASGGIKGIVGYMNAQPDIQFASFGPEFDASREDLHNQLMGISDSLKSLSNNTSEYSDLINEDLKAVNDQLYVVFNLLADHLTDASEPSIEELYEEVNEEDIDSIITGRTDSCTNNGIVKGDINIGGIAGSMSIDEEDPEDNAAGSVDYQVGRRFITKCIISDSTNRGYITAKKDGAGGIVGYTRHGIVMDCEGYGSVESTEGNYTGGIVGESLTVVKDCYALCSVSGSKDVGGIAGCANTLQGCYAIVSAKASVGKMGAIAGQITSAEDSLVIDNYFVGDDIYGIDNISYAGIAEPISYTELLTMEHLPVDFWHLKVTYRIEDTYLGTQEVKFGESLATLDYPEIPVKEGYYGVWPDYSDQVMKGNLIIEGDYMDTVTVVESLEKAETETETWQKPYALVEQTFTEDTVLNVALSNMEPPTQASGKAYTIYDILLENGNIGNTDIFAVRLLNPYENEAQVWGYTDGIWTRLESKTRGQYLQVNMTGAKETFCIIEVKSNNLLRLLAGISIIAVLLFAVYFIKRIKTRLRQKEQRID